MDLQQASNLSTIDDVVNMLQIQLVIFYFVLPILFILVVAFAISRNKMKRQQKKKEKELQKKLEKQKKEQAKHQKEIIDKRKEAMFSSTENMLKQLDDIEEPLVKSDYRDLVINFDKNGKMIKENNQWQQEVYH